MRVAARPAASRSFRSAPGVIAYQGPSAIDGAPIVGIVTVGRVGNPKIGRGTLQLWVLRSDVAPWEAITSGADVGVCGACPHRLTEYGRACYVRNDPLSSVWGAYARGSYAPWSRRHEVRIRRSGEALRWGAYGEPAALPPHAIRLIAGWLGDRVRVSRRAPGYTHRWRERPDLRGLLMASVDSPRERAEAKAAGWRTFRSLAPWEGLLPGEGWCPATPEGGERTACDRCGLCDGVQRPDDRRMDVAARVHGPGASAYIRRRIAMGEGPRLSLGVVEQ